MLIPARVHVEAAAVELGAGGEADVLLFDQGIRIAAAELEAFKALAGDDVRHAGHGLGAVERRGAVGEHFDALDHRDRELVDVEIVGAGGVGHGRDAGALAVEQRQRRAEAEVAHIEHRRAGPVVGFVVELRAAVDGQFLEHIDRLRRADPLDRFLIDHLHRLGAVEARAADIRSGDDDLLKRFLVLREQRRCRADGGGDAGGKRGHSEFVGCHDSTLPS